MSSSHTSTGTVTVTGTVAAPPSGTSTGTVTVTGTVAAAPPPPPSGDALGFAEISKLFSLPIADASSILGVCTSVLKRICRENGIVRWPYRKFLAGKTVEEIQKEAAREKKRELAELAKAARNATASAGISSTSGSTPAHILQQQQLQGNRLLFQNLPKNIPAFVDEFKQGFPSDGLLTVTTKWWGSITNSPDDGNEDEEETEEPSKTDQVEEKQKQSSELADKDSAAIERKSDGVAEADEDNSNNNIGPQGTALLSSLRKRAAEEGRELFKLGVYKTTSFKLGRKEKQLLHKVFNSSLPSQWALD